MKKYFTVKRLAIIGLLSALVMLFSWLYIPTGTSRFHLGNVFCCLSGLLFGPVAGGLASGIGSMLYDMTNPAYMAESWITLLTKFPIGFLAGLIAFRGDKRSLAKDGLGALAGSLVYVCLYVLKHIIRLLLAGSAFGAAVTTAAVEKAPASLVNALIAVVASVALAQVLRPALAKAGLKLDKGN